MVGEAFDQRLRELVDKQEIAECIIRLARGLDRHDAAEAKSSYSPDAWDHHVVFVGPGHNVVDWANAYHDQTLRGHQHYVSNILIDLDGDEAHAESYVKVVGVSREDWSNTVGGGRYLDRFERRDGRWLIVDRVATLEWWSDPDIARTSAKIVHPYSQDRDDPSYLRPLRFEREGRDLSKKSNGFRDRTK